MSDIFGGQAMADESPVARAEIPSPAPQPGSSLSATYRILPIALGATSRPPARSTLGSGLIAHNQKITVAARAMAERKAIGHLS